MRVLSVVSLVVSVVFGVQAYAQAPKTEEEARRLADNCAASCMARMKEGEKAEVFTFKVEPKAEFVCSAAQAGSGEPCGEKEEFKKGRALCKSKGKPLILLVSCGK